jgi:hypothetical protein
MYVIGLIQFAVAVIFAGILRKHDEEQQSR